MLINHTLDLLLLDDRLAICRLDARSPIPPWALTETFGSITRTRDELSIVCPEASVPATVRAEGGWRLLRVIGTQDFGLVGVLASLVHPIAQAGVSLFAISTFDTDYLLIKEDHFTRARDALLAAGHSLAVSRDQT